MLNTGNIKRRLRIFSNVTQSFEESDTVLDYVNF